MEGSGGPCSVTPELSVGRVSLQTRGAVLSRRDCPHPGAPSGLGRSHGHLCSLRDSQVVPFSTKDRPTRSIISPGWSLSNVVVYGWGRLRRRGSPCGNALWWYVDERRCVKLFSGGGYASPSSLRLSRRCQEPMFIDPVGLSGATLQ